MTNIEKIKYTVRRMMDMFDLEDTPENELAIITAMRDEKKYHGVPETDPTMIGLNALINTTLIG